MHRDEDDMMRMRVVKGGFVLRYEFLVQAEHNEMSRNLIGCIWCDLSIKDGSAISSILTVFGVAY